MERKRPSIKKKMKNERKSGERSDLSGQTAKQPSSDDHPLDLIRLDGFSYSSHIAVK